MIGLEKKVVIAIDAMGGDGSPDVVLEGINIILKKEHNVRFHVFGDSNRLAPLLRKYPLTKKYIKVFHTDLIISDSMKPSAAVRRGANTSMQLAIADLSNGNAHAVVSAGNTGALMALSLKEIKKMDIISRPAIAGIMPTSKGKSCMLDLGAVTTPEPKNLYQYAYLGTEFAKVLLDKRNPSVGLLNIGKEENKGNGTIQDASRLIKESNLNYYGFIEGNDILSGVVDVIVCDGFSGNVALKTMEGTAKFCRNLLKKAMDSSLLTQIALYLAKTTLKKSFKTIDPRGYNGAMFLGLNGIVIKSHGGADAYAFSNSIAQAIKLSRKEIIELIKKDYFLANE